MPEFRRKPDIGAKPTAAVLPADVTAWSPESRRSFAAEADAPLYRDLRLGCRRCGREFVFSAVRQQYAFEVRKAYVWQRPVVCPDCWTVRRQLLEESRRLQARWSAQRAAMKRDVAALRRWRDVLEALAVCGLRLDKAKIAMLRRRIESLETQPPTRCERTSGSQER